LNAKDKYKNSIIQNKNEGNHKFFIFNLLLKFIYIYIYIIYCILYFNTFIYLFIYFEFYTIFNYKLKIFNDV